MEGQLQSGVTGIFTRSFLESLATRELMQIADRSGIDIPPGLDRVFIIRELLENQDEEYPEETSLLGKEGLETVQIPRQYNITFLEVLVRDPLWVFAFWEIKKTDRERFEGDPDFGGYYLRVLPLSAGGTPGFPGFHFSEPCPPVKTFLKGEARSVQVGLDDNSWYLGFPPGGGSFKVELYVFTGEQRALAVSRPFTLPRLLEKQGSSRSLENPLIRLSGEESFSVLRNTDRQSRLRSYEA
jgi:hypothetical protein